MLVLWGTLAGMAFWAELVYHFSGFGWTAFHPLYVILLITAWSGLWSLLVGVLKSRRAKKIFYYTALWLPVVITGVQLVYLRIFHQPLLWGMVVQGAHDALTNYWREALLGVLKTMPFIALLALPAVVIPVFLRRNRWRMPLYDALGVLRTLVIVFAATMGSVGMLELGEAVPFEYYEEYHEFYDPVTVAESMGILPTLHADVGRMLRQWLYRVGNGKSGGTGEYVPAVVPNAVVWNGAPSQSPAPDDSSETEGQEAEPEPSPEGPEIVPQQFQLDYDLLHQLADNDHQTWLADYIQSEPPVNSNEYTGMFEGYNLIFLTAEGFCSYAIDEELTPTLYRMSHSGFVCENYYVPLWQTSTSDGEYINMTGLIPDQMHSMKRSKDNAFPYNLAAYFASEGVQPRAYHDNSLSYYDRHLTHTNMGYDFKACKLGDLDEAEWGDKVFPMENANKWPASDYDMMVATVPEYVNDERFHVYYMTVSGHMNYSFSGNAMSSKNKDAVAGLDLSEGPKAYIACNIELDKAMENLLAQLEAAGQLENTVICLSADHYPYGLSDDEYQELAGKDLTGGKDKFRNTLILYNAGMEEPIYIQKACSSMDLLPTLLNLFGFQYDSRMYAGRDILSDREGMVIFNNRDFVTDSVIFIEKGDIATWLKDEDGNDIMPPDLQEAYLDAMRTEVKRRYNFSAYVLQEDYYRDVEQAVIPQP